MGERIKREVNVVANKHYYTGLGVTGHTQDGKLLLVEFSDARTVIELAKRADGVMALLEKLREDGIE